MYDGYVLFWPSIYLSAIETLICLTEIEFNRVYFLRFCREYLIRFSKYHIELIVALSWTNATKMVGKGEMLVHVFPPPPSLLSIMSKPNLCCDSQLPVHFFFSA